MREGLLLPYLKAVVGLIAPGAVVIGAAVTAASDGGTAITGAEWVTAVVACIVTAAGVYVTPNALTKRARARLELEAFSKALENVERALHEPLRGGPLSRGSAVNADTGEVTGPGEPLPPIDGAQVERARLAQQRRRGRL